MRGGLVRPRVVFGVGVAHPSLMRPWICLENSVSWKP